ncbi:putative inactive receptor kinase [Abeliophyllum distichum]|uniref:Inactive receptor kinase n=1 Tax=Abeliophyllum distichum TaxID=126358 RepID=A0ABD1RH20_9LAMI
MTYNRSDDDFSGLNDIPISRNIVDEFGDSTDLIDLDDIQEDVNQFLGPVSNFIFSVHSLVRLNLAYNNFSRKIPSGFNNFFVKRLKDVTISEKEFKDEIEWVGAINHENLVPLRAYYYSREEKLLDYDYIPMGSLSARLHGE